MTNKVVLHYTNNKIQVDEVAEDSEFSIYADPIDEILDEFNEGWCLKKSKYEVGEIVLFYLDDMKCFGIIDKVKKVQTYNNEYIEYYENSYHNEESKIINIKGTIGKIDKKHYKKMETK